MKGAWVLRLKDESKEGGMEGEFYYDGMEVDEESEHEFLTQNLNCASVFYNKDEAINYLKIYEKTVYEKYGEDAICNFGYTNMMKIFEFVEVEVEIIYQRKE